MKLPLLIGILFICCGFTTGAWQTAVVKGIHTALTVIKWVQRIQLHHGAFFQREVAPEVSKTLQNFEKKFNQINSNILKSASAGDYEKVEFFK